MAETARQGRSPHMDYGCAGRGCERRDATLHGCRKGGLLFFAKGSLLWNFSIADDALILDIGDQFIRTRQKSAEQG
jgi:hypothetical protein